MTNWEKGRGWNKQILSLLISGLSHWMPWGLCRLYGGNYTGTEFPFHSHRTKRGLDFSSLVARGLCCLELVITSPVCVRSSSDLSHHSPLLSFSPCNHEYKWTWRNNLVYLNKNAELNRFLVVTLKYVKLNSVMYLCFVWAYTNFKLIIRFCLLCANNHWK